MKISFCFRDDGRIDWVMTLLGWFLAGLSLAVVVIILVAVFGPPGPSCPSGYFKAYRLETSGKVSGYQFFGCIAEQAS